MLLPTDELSITLDGTAIAVLGGIGALLVAVLAVELRHVPKSLLVLMAAAFLDMVGLFMVMPILPFYVKAFAAQGVSLFGSPLAEGTLTGLVTSSFTVAQLLSAPWWGRLSDRRGRRPVLLIALAASAVAFLLFGFAEALWLVVLSRLVQGAGGGTVGVIQSYVADSVEPAERARALGWLSAATNLGVAFGPVLGSLAVTLGAHDLLPGDGELRLGRAMPGVAASLLCVANIVFAWRWLPESKSGAKRQQPAIRPLAATVQVFAQPGAPAARLLLIYGIAIGAAQGVNPTMVLYLGDRFGFNETTIGYVFMYIGALSVFARTLVLGRAVDRFGEVVLSRVGIGTLACGLAALAFVVSLPTLAGAVALLPLGMALTFPCLTSMLSRVVSAADRGMYMGLQQSFGGVARLCAPLAYGIAYDHIGHGSPFVIAGGVVAGTLLLGIGLGRSVPPKSTKVA